MITANNYQDIQIMQNADFENIITFDASVYDVDNYKYKAIIAKDRNGTAFTYDGNSNTTFVGLTVTKTSNGSTSQTVTLKLTAAQTSKFEDDFEGVWDLLAQEVSGGSPTGTYIREMEGEVVISPSVSTLTNHEFS